MACVSRRASARDGRKGKVTAAPAAAVIRSRGCISESGGQLGPVLPAAESIPGERGGVSRRPVEDREVESAQERARQGEVERAGTITTGEAARSGGRKVILVPPDPGRVELQPTQQALPQAGADKALAIDLAGGERGGDGSRRFKRKPC